MKVLVDTSVWSLVLRRDQRHNVDYRRKLQGLIEEGRVEMLGAIRQELLSGVKEPAQFRSLRNHLRSFPDLDLEVEDYEDAAVCFNKCQAVGIQGSNTDFLICAVSLRRGLSIFTTDKDFERYAKVLRFRLLRAG